MMRGTRHFGRFAIKLEVLEGYADTLICDLFSQMIIVRAEHLLAEDTIEYVGWSKKLFRNVECNERIPIYNIVVSDGEITAKEVK